MPFLLALRKFCLGIQTGLVALLAVQPAFSLEVLPAVTVNPPQTPLAKLINDLDTLPTETIEKAEIERGPGAAYDPFQTTTSLLRPTIRTGGPSLTIPIDESVQINASIRYAVSSKTEVYLRGENLTNNRSSQLYSTDMPGVAVYGGFQTDF
jgi:hypothetical protein